MKYMKLYSLTAATLATLALTGCGNTPNPEESFIYNGHNFGENKNVNFIQGVKDGCKTLTGAYTKDHDLFNSNESYKAGWEDGRLNCNKNEEEEK
ncbi:hypothetical protein MNB_SV-5-306 [hydrothermal vent metagenome]|uniref:Lipoprotein n=1 Tax=hydrothermal vent metagenome TaxID=652676 RepID=A0A1W1EFW2_9ZZZZ